MHLSRSAYVPKILYGVSPIGLGHATRDIVIVEELRRQGAEVKLFSGGKAAEFIRGQGYDVEDIVDDPVPYVSKGVMRRVALWYIRSWFAYRRTLKRTERLFDDYGPDLVVGDEEFTGMGVAERRGKKRVFISDELTLGFGRTWISRKLEDRVEGWYRRLQDTVDLLIIPENGSDSGNRRFVGPIVRPRSGDCVDVRRKFNLPDGKLILFSTSGSGIGRELLDAVIGALKDPRLRGVNIVVTGNRGSKIEMDSVLDLGLVSENQDLIACADLVVSTAGKSTIDEAQAAGTPIIAIPIKYHAEQERNAATLGYNSDDAKRLPDLIASKISQRGPPLNFDGEVEASRLILSVL